MLNRQVKQERSYTRKNQVWDNADNALLCLDLAPIKRSIKRHHDARHKARKAVIRQLMDMD